MRGLILNEATAEILIYGVIGDPWGDGVMARNVRDALKQVGQRDVNVRIHSPGGSVFEASAIHTYLTEWKHQVSVSVDGLAASAASVVAMAGHTVKMAATSMMMIHDPWTISMGDAAALRKDAELLDKIRDQIAEVYAKRAGGTAAQFQELMAKETWLTPEEAISLGLADEITGQASVENRYDLSAFKNAPKVWPQPKADAGTPRRTAMRQRLATAEI